MHLLVERVDISTEGADTRAGEHIAGVALLRKHALATVAEVNVRRVNAGQQSEQYYGARLTA